VKEAGHVENSISARQASNAVGFGLEVCPVGAYEHSVAMDRSAERELSGAQGATKPDGLSCTLPPMRRSLRGRDPTNRSIASKMTLAPTTINYAILSYNPDV
jgi:hypothetical protein